jgi:predicted acylesterase/phospholipase RssA
MSAPVTGSSEDEYQQPTEECDIIMKGGLTSGIAYPVAILELARKFRFRSIGGTSAGAIAAALTAAAEYGREHGGFRRLRGVSDELCKGSRIVDLFQPAASTRPLMVTILEATRRYSMARAGTPQDGVQSRRVARFADGIRKTINILFVQLPGVLFATSPFLYSILVVTGTVIGATLAFFVLRGFRTDLPTVGWFLPVLALYGLALGWVAGVLGMFGFLFRIAAKQVPRNLYGVCTGHETGPQPKERALTDWLHARINLLAGRDPEDAPLTIGDLKRKGEGDVDSGERSITLRTMTADLNHAQPFVVPFEGHTLIINMKEMEQLFPGRVVQHLQDRAAGADEFVFADPCNHFALLPTDDAFPVVVAARLSLGFPLLLSAVPLYTIARSALVRKTPGSPLVLEKTDLQKNWFSDGGIASNFPIHFFDVWLPSRPTFGINLTTMSEDSFEGDERAGTSVRARESQRVKVSRRRVRAERQTAFVPMSPEDVAGRPRVGGMPHAVESATERLGDGGGAEAVYLPRGDEATYAAWTEINDVIGFLMGVWTTAQNYRDSMQTQLPSYRERVVEVRFSPLEGGLKLALGQAEIKSLVDKGRRAGALLCNEFSFGEHQWVRFLVLMAQLEAQLRRTTVPFPDSEAYARMLRNSMEGNYPYRHDSAWCAEAGNRMEALLGLLTSWDEHQKIWKTRSSGWGEQSFFGRNAPQPVSTLRVTPMV